MRALVAASLLVAACGEPNAVLELYVTLPPAPATGPSHVLVQARRADAFAFEVADWLDTADLDTVPLGPEGQVDHISIESIGEDDFDLNVRIRWCQSVGCSDPADDPTRVLTSCIRLAHPFYLGHRTEYRIEDLAIADASMGACPDAAVIEVDRCAIRGCAGGDPSPTYCRMDDSHLCE